MGGLGGRRDDQVKINGMARRGVGRSKFRVGERRIRGERSPACVITRAKLRSDITRAPPRRRAVMTLGVDGAYKLLARGVLVGSGRAARAGNAVELSAGPATGKICGQVGQQVPTMRCSGRVARSTSVMAEMGSQELGRCEIWRLRFHAHVWAATSHRVACRTESEETFGSGSNCDQDGGGTFGEALGVFAPIELLNRPVFNDVPAMTRRGQRRGLANQV